MKKRRFISAAAFATAMAMLLCSHGYGTSSEYNDKTYKSYGNLTEDSEIPSLFKNDDVFANYKSYPPVISDGIEYVPLELFYGLSDFKINYSDDNSNFYIQNKQTNEYISFSITDNYAVTGKNKVYETNVPTYYGVHYVPLRTVCDSVGIGCSTYNDGENKVYAIEIYTNQESLSAQELLKIHAPELYASSEPAEENAEEAPVTADSGNTTTAQSPGIGSFSDYYSGSQTGYTYETGADNSGTTASTGKPEQESAPQETGEEVKAAPEYKSGTVMFFYTPEMFEDAGKTLDALDELGIPAVFFVTEQNILEAPGTVRRIYTSGHTLGIYLERSDGLFEPGILEERITSAENALYEVTKSKTRLIYLGETSDEQTALPAEVSARIEKMGLCPVKLNADARTDKLGTQKAADAMKTGLRDIKRNYGNDTAYIRMQHTDSGIASLGAAAVVSMANPSVRIDVFDETKIQRK